MEGEVSHSTKLTNETNFPVASTDTDVTLVLRDGSNSSAFVERMSNCDTQEKTRVELSSNTEMWFEETTTAADPELQESKLPVVNPTLRLAGPFCMTRFENGEVSFFIMERSNLFEDSLDVSQCGVAQQMLMERIAWESVFIWIRDLSSMTSWSR